MRTIEETMAKLREKWGKYDSDFLLSAEVKEMSPEQRGEYLERMANLYLKADSEASVESLRTMAQAQREAYTEGNCNFYDGD